MTRVGIITYALDRPLTGIGRYTVELIRALVQLPDAPEITLLTSGASGPLKELGLPEVNLPLTRLAPQLLLSGALQVPRITHHLKLDIVHDMSGMAPFALGSGNTKTLVMLYDVIPLSYPGVSTQWDTLVYRHWLPLILPRVDGILTISDCSKLDIMKYMKLAEEKIHNISGGVHPRYQSSSLEEIRAAQNQYQLPNRYILFVGSSDKRKNLLGCLEAYAKLDSSLFPHHLVIVGPKQRVHEKIQQIVQQLQLENRVHFTGYVAADDLASVYSGADLFLFPSFYEGFGLPVLEAMACGTPVICSNVSSLPEVVGDAAITVNPYQMDELVNAIRRVLSDSTLREEMRGKGLIHANQFTWQKSAQATLNIYHELLSA